MKRAGEGCPRACTWTELGEGWQQCADTDCGIERRDPRLADRAAMESGRKVPVTPSQPICGPNSPDVPGSATASEGAA